MFKLTTFAVGILFLYGCAAVMDRTDYTAGNPGPVPDYEDAKDQAMDGVRSLLKDPQSAQFRTFTPLFKMRYSYGPGSSDEMLWAMCVEANAKNSFGGYGDYEWFMVKFRDGRVVRDVNGLYRPEYPISCLEGPVDPARRAPD